MSLQQNVTPKYVTPSKHTKPPSTNQWAPGPKLVDILIVADPIV